ncbi:hypothetical protein IEQ34_009960 [Dendrobium chrysotoxum]|uniref:Uncharacterized protein n=1 Tax=Dendrobium chrysotoxum TaxID=161865 RepID=A0AAV7H2D2_DENCH|nr:hypothetical protein IEQ34_009960 [Dendrobium chrysotoxum]
MPLCLHHVALFYCLYILLVAIKPLLECSFSHLYLPLFGTGAHKQGHQWINVIREAIDKHKND